VVLSGGEPCIQTELPDLVREIKKLRLLVKLDTNGMSPEMLERLFSREETRPDYLALDLKVAPERYRQLPPVEKPDGGLGFSRGERLIKSAALIRSFDIIHEYRTLALPAGFISAADIEALAPLTDSGPWYFRVFRPGNCLDPAWDKIESPQAEDAKALAQKAREFGKNGICPAQPAALGSRAPPLDLPKGFGENEP
jgi:pyruvate formate lyase activating enzyme